MSVLFKKRALAKICESTAQNKTKCLPSDFFFSFLDSSALSALAACRAGKRLNFVTFVQSRLAKRHMLKDLWREAVPAVSFSISSKQHLFGEKKLPPCGVYIQAVTGTSFSKTSHLDGQ